MSLRLLARFLLRALFSAVLILMLLGGSGDAFGEETRGASFKGYLYPFVFALGLIVPVAVFLLRRSGATISEGVWFASCGLGGLVALVFLVLGLRVLEAEKHLYR